MPTAAVLRVVVDSNSCAASSLAPDPHNTGDGAGKCVTDEVHSRMRSYGSLQRASENNNVARAANTCLAVGAPLSALYQTSKRNT